MPNETPIPSSLTRPAATTPAVQPEPTVSPFPRNAVLTAALEKLRAANAAFRSGFLRRPSTVSHEALTAAQAVHAHAMMAYAARDIAKAQPLGSAKESLNTVAAAVLALGKNTTAAQVLDCLKRLAAQEDGSGRDAIIGALMTHKPSELIARLTKMLDSAAIARAVYSALVAAYPDARDSEALRAKRALAGELGAAQQAIADTLAADLDPKTHRATLATIRQKLIDDLYLSFTDRNQLLTRYSLLMARIRSAEETIGKSAQVRDRLLKFLPASQPQATMTPAAQLHFFRRQSERLRQFEKKLEEAIARQTLTPADQRLLKQASDTLRRDQPERVRAVLMAAFRGKESLGAALEQAAASRYVVMVEGEPVNVLDALLNVGVFMLGFTPKTLDRFLTVLESEIRKPGAWARVAAMGQGDARAIDAVLPGAHWDDVRWAMLSDFTPAAAAKDDGQQRQRLIDTRFALSIASRELARELAGFDFTQAASESSVAKLAAAAKAAGGIEAIDLKLANWVILSLKAQGDMNCAEAGKLLAMLGIDETLETVERCIDQGFSNTAHIHKVQEQLARLGKHLGKNRAVMATGGGRAAEAARLFALQGVLSTRLAAAPARTTLPTDSERLKDWEQAELQAAENLVDRTHQRSQIKAQRDALLARLVQDKPQGHWDRIRPEQFKHAHTLQGIVAADAAMRGEQKARQFAAAARIMADRDQMIAALAAYDPQTMDLGREIPKDESNAQRMAVLEQAAFHAQILLDVQKLDAGIAAMDGAIAAEQAKLQNINAEKARHLGVRASQAAARQSANSALGRLMARVNEAAAPGPERSALQDMIAYATIEVCKETTDPATGRPIEPSAFVPSEHRTRLIQKLRQLGLDTNRILQGGPERVRQFVADLDTRVPLSRLSARWASSQADFASLARVYMGTVLSRTTQQLKAEEFFTFEFGTEGMLSMSVPEPVTAMTGGIGMAIQARLASTNSVRVECVAELPQKQYEVTVMGGREGEVNLGISALLGALEASAGASGNKLDGCRLRFSGEQDCQAFLAALVDKDGKRDPQDLTKASVVALVTQSGVAVTASATAAPPNPVRLYTGGAGMGEIGVGLKAQAEAGAGAAWITSTTAHGEEHVRIHRRQATASASINIATGSDTVNQAGAAVVDALRGKSGATPEQGKVESAAARVGTSLERAGSKMSIATGYEVRETTRLVTRSGSLSPQSRIELVATVTAGNAVRAWETVASRISTNNAQFMARTAAWLSQATDGTSFRIILRPSPDAVEDYNWAIANAAELEKTDPAAARDIVDNANTALAQAMRPSRVELRSDETVAASTASGAIDSAALGTAATLAPVARRDSAASTTSKVIDAIELGALFDEDLLAI